MLRRLMRYYSYLYHLILCLFLLAVGAIAMATDNVTLQLNVLPWQDPALTYWVFFGGLAGFLALVLAVTGRLRLLFRLWTPLVFLLMAYGFFIRPYGFSGAGPFRNALLLTFGALLAMLGSWFRVGRRV